MPGTIVIGVEGELELASATVAREAFDRVFAEDHERIVADLRRLSFIDSSGIRALVDLRERCIAARTGLEVLIDDGPVHRTLSVCGVLGLLDNATPSAVAA